MLSPPRQKTTNRFGSRSQFVLLNTIQTIKKYCSVQSSDSKTLCIMEQDYSNYQAVCACKVSAYCLVLCQGRSQDADRSKESCKTDNYLNCLGVMTTDIKSTLFINCIYCLVFPKHLNISVHAMFYHCSIHSTSREGSAYTQTSICTDLTEPPHSSLRLYPLLRRFVHWVPTPSVSVTSLFTVSFHLRWSLHYVYSGNFCMCSWSFCVWFMSIQLFNTFFNFGH